MSVCFINFYSYTYRNKFDNQMIFVRFIQPIILYNRKENLNPLGSLHSGR
jgi:hypothetical protein